MLRWTVYLKGGPMTTCLAAVAAGHKVYCFGGHCNINKRDEIEVHIFNTVPLRWMKLPSVATVRELPLEVPSMRDGHTAVLIEDIAYIWGGVTHTGVYCNILYAYDIDTHMWFKPRISGTAPEVRRNHSACVLGKCMYIFVENTIEIYKLDTTTMVWSIINTRDTPARASSYHSATIIGTKVFVFGCRRDSDQFKDYYNNIISVFDTETNLWLSTPSAELVPEGRKGHSAFAYNGELYIFGGENLNRLFSDMWKFNPETFTWKKVELGPKGKGPRPSTFKMCCCMVGDCIILFGGYRYTPDELYMLDLSPSMKTLCKLAVIKYRLEQSGLPHNIRWELAAMTTTSKRKHSPLKRTHKKQRTH